MNNFFKYLITTYIFLFTIGCDLGLDIDEPTHFDIRKMRCHFSNASTEYYYHYDGEYLILAFTDSIYYFTPRSGFNFSLNTGYLYAQSTYSGYHPSEEIEKIIIIAHAYNNTYHSGDTINAITNIEELLVSKDHKAQEFINVSFKEPHTVDRHLTIHYYQTNGEYYTCEVKDEL